MTYALGAFRFLACGTGRASCKCWQYPGESPDTNVYVVSCKLRHSQTKHHGHQTNSSHHYGQQHAPPPSSPSALPATLLGRISTSFISRPRPFANLACACAITQVLALVLLCLLAPCMHCPQV